VESLSLLLIMSLLFAAAASRGYSPLVTPANIRVPDLWGLPPKPPAPGTLPPGGEAHVHAARARYLTALDKHKAWRRTLRCTDPARLNEYEDRWYPHYLLEARRELLEQDPSREDDPEREEFCKREEHFALCQFELIKRMTVKDEFQFAAKSDGGVRKKLQGEQEQDVHLANEVLPWDMAFVRAENERQDARERREHVGRGERKEREEQAARQWRMEREERERRQRLEAQQRRNNENFCEEWMQWYNALGWTCQGRTEMPVIAYGSDFINTADVQVLVAAAYARSISWIDSDPDSSFDESDQRADTLPAVTQQMAAALAHPSAQTLDPSPGNAATTPDGLLTLEQHRSMADEEGTSSPPALEELLRILNGHGIVVAAAQRAESATQPVIEQLRNRTDAQATASSPAHEEFLRRCNRSGVAVTAPRTESPAQPVVREIQEIAPFSHRRWYEEFLDLAPIRRRVGRIRVPKGQAGW